MKNRSNKKMALFFLLVVQNSLGQNQPPSVWGDSFAAAAPTCNELSTSIGSHMVLQRAPEKAVIYGSVCGDLAGAKTVSASIDGGAPTTVSIASGDTTWQIALPPQEGGLVPHTIKVSGGQFAASLVDVMFGEAVLCSGQSNSKEPSLSHTLVPPRDVSDV